jgi:hypothetical protein
MKTLASGLALVLGAAFVSIAVASPSHADRCSAMGLFSASAPWQQCERDNPLTPSNDDGTPVCQQNTGPTGNHAACTSCLTAITNPNLAPQVGFDCGANGGSNLMGGKPHCMVGTKDTGRLPPDCSGDLQPDGTVTEIN